MDLNLWQALIIPLLIIFLPIVEILGKKFLEWVHSKTKKGQEEKAAKEAQYRAYVEETKQNSINNLKLSEDRLVSVLQATENRLDKDLSNISSEIEKQAKSDETVKKDVALLKESIQGSLRLELRDQYSKYKKEGWVPSDTKRDIDHLHDLYSQLGTNGVMNRAHNDFMNLPEEMPEIPRRRSTDRK